MSARDLVFSFVIVAAGALLVATLRRIVAGRAPADAPQLACMAGATLLYALNARLHPRAPWGAVLVGGGLLLALAAIGFFVARRPKR